MRRVLPHELARCQQAVCEKHYLKTADLVGEQLWYVAERHGQWLALPGWSAAAYHLKGRDAWIGWNDTQLFRGTCYKATGWQAVGCTAGFQRVAQDFYQVHDRPKQLFVRQRV